MISNTRPHAQKIGGTTLLTFSFFTDEGQINRVPSVKYLGVVVDEIEMEDVYQ